MNFELRWTLNDRLRHRRGRPRFCGDLVVGGWFGLDRRNGDVCWERRLRIAGVQQARMLVNALLVGAARHAWSARPGVAVLDATNGFLLWSSTEMTPVDVIDAELLCADGVARELRTGTVLGPRELPRVALFSLRESLRIRVRHYGPMVVLPDLVLRGAVEADGETRDCSADLCSCSGDGTPLHWFSPGLEGWISDAHFGQFIQPPLVFFVACRETNHRYYWHPVGALGMEYLPTEYWLGAFDLRSGSYVASMSLGVLKRPPHIHDADANEVLLSTGEKSLALFALS